MGKLKLALIGFGVIGKRHLLASGEVDHVDIVAIADPSFVDGSIKAAAVSALKETAYAGSLPIESSLYSSTTEMLDQVKPDGVIVATPTEHHLEPSLLSLKAGAHVLIEKPIMANLDECAQVIKLSKSSQKHVLVAHQRRYYSFVETARKIISDGEIGQLVCVSGQWTMRKPVAYYQADWRKKWQAGPILTNLIHDMDMIRYIAGDVTSLSAETASNVMGFEKEDTAAILLRFANGALGTFLLSDQSHSPWSWEHGFGENAAFPPSGQNSMRFMGTEGSLDFPNLNLWKSKSGESCWNNIIVGEPLDSQIEDAYIQQLMHFADVINGECAPRVSAKDATATLQATLAVYKASETGRRVELTN